MTKVRTWAGLDVHAVKVIACVVDAQSGEMTVHRLPGTTSELVAFCAGLPGPTRIGYEAGPTGFGLARALATVGIGCVIAAPGKIERPAADRVKTDQRDAERLRALGYEVQSEKLSAPRFINPIVQEAYDEGSPMFRFQVQPTKHRVPVARIFYQLRGSTRNATPGQESIERDG